jgi:antitoxin ChpS
MAHSAKLRKVGGSVMLAIPPAFLDSLALKPDAAVSLSLQSGRLVVEPEKHKKHSLDVLLAEHVHPLDEDAEWTTSAPAGREII